MICCLENEKSVFLVDTLGAEMQSFQLKGDGKEYVWQAKPTVWNRHAPILFPIIAGLKDGYYTIEGRKYDMELHGFAKDIEFKVVEQTSTSLHLQLTSEMLDEKYIKSYPFIFQLDVIYTLEGASVSKKHIVTNLGKTRMYYELGGHDGYNIALEEDETMEDYYLDLNMDIASIDALVLHPESRHVTKDIRTHKLEHGKYNVGMETFSGDTFIIHKPEFNRVTLRSEKSSRFIDFMFEGFDVFAMWSAYKDGKVTNYVCLEPWSSLPDCEYLGQELEEKVDVKILERGESAIYKFTTTIG